MNKSIVKTKYALINATGRILFEFGDQETMESYIHHYKKSYGSAPLAKPARIETTTVVTIIE